METGNKTRVRMFFRFVRKHRESNSLIRKELDKLMQIPDIDINTQEYRDFDYESPWEGVQTSMRQIDPSMITREPSSDEEQND